MSTTTASPKAAGAARHAQCEKNVGEVLALANEYIEGRLEVQQLTTAVRRLHGRQ